MAIEWENGVPILTNESRLGEVPAYTQELAAVVGGSVPVGTIISYAFNPAPLAPNWLSCDGTTVVSEATHKTLYDLLMDQWGSATIPDLGGRVPIGVNNTYTLKSTGGTATHTLSLDEMPNHNHGGATGVTDTNHTHLPWASTAFLSTNGGVHSAAGGHYGAPTHTDANTSFVDRNATHTHTITSQGSNWAHNNMQPYIAVHYIIKAL